MIVGMLQKQDLRQGGTQDCTYLTLRDDTCLMNKFVNVQVDKKDRSPKNAGKAAATTGK